MTDKEKIETIERFSAKQAKQILDLHAKIRKLKKSLSAAAEYLSDIATEPNGSGFYKHQHAQEALEMIEWKP